jgi:hypothetical protein
MANITLNHISILNYVSPVPCVAPLVVELIVNVGVDPVMAGGTVPVVTIVVAVDGV